MDCLNLAGSEGQTGERGSSNCPFGFSMKKGKSGKNGQNGQKGKVEASWQRNEPWKSSFPNSSEGWDQPTGANMHQKKSQKSGMKNHNWFGRSGESDIKNDGEHDDRQAHQNHDNGSFGNLNFQRREEPKSFYYNTGREPLANRHHYSKHLGSPSKYSETYEIFYTPKNSQIDDHQKTNSNDENWKSKTDFFLFLHLFRNFRTKLIY